MPSMATEREAGWADLERAAADRESGATEIARRAAEALAALPPSDLQEAVRALVRGHPSMAPLWRLGTEALSAGAHPVAARAFSTRLARETEEVAGAAARWMLEHERPDAVVLHSSSDTLAHAVRAMELPAICGRSEPGGEGRAMAARIAELGGTARVVEDAEALAAASRHPVLVGADAVGPGGVVNKVGTGALADAAAAASMPCLVLTGSSKLVSVDLPAPAPFERVPLARFTAIVTEAGATAPGELGLERYALDPHLETRAE